MVRTSVVRSEARRRWAVVLAAVLVLGAVPVVVGAWPAGAGTAGDGSAEALRDRIALSASQAYEGYADSVGALGLPEIPRLGQVTSMFSGTTHLRAWHAGRDRWRVDVIGTGSERGVYQTPGGQYTWDYGDNQLSFVGREPSPRLPRAADLVPADLGRRLVSMAAGDRLERIADRRVAGRGAAGLRIVPASAHTTVGHIDLWADPGSGLPLEVRIYAKGAVRPILSSRFLDVRLGAPAQSALAPPARRAGVGFTAAEGVEGLDGIFDRDGLGELPETVSGLERRETQGPAAAYGTGLAQVAVVPLTRRIGGVAFRNVGEWGEQVTLPSGSAVLLSSSVLSLMILRSEVRRQTYLLAGMVDGALLRQVGTALSGSAA